MTINVEWDRTKGLKAKARVVAVILNPMEQDVSLFEVQAALEQARETLVKWGNIQTMRIEADLGGDCGKTEKETQEPAGPSGEMPIGG